METKYNFQKNFVFFKANIILMLKSIFEYKGNFLFDIGYNIIRIITLLSFIIIFSNSFSDIIEWSRGDFLLYGILVNLVFDICGLFIWKEGLKKFILNGELNQFLVRPILPFFGFSFSKLAAPGLFMFIFDILLLLILINYFSIHIFNLFAGFTLFIFIVFLFLLQDWFIKSINFWNYGIPAILWEIKESGNSIMRTYPSNFFISSNFMDIFMIIPYFFIGSLLMPLLRNYSYSNISFQLYFILILIIFYSIGLYINWKFGLKKFEAFG